MAAKTLEIIDLGLVPYQECWDLQRRLQRERIEDQIPDTLLICEHPAVITMGRGTKRENLLATPERLKQMNIELFEIERGGDVTYHAPGQLVGYPILNLKQHKTDVGWYMRQLEEIVIRTCTDFDLVTGRIKGKTGVWVEGVERSITNRKIASLGVRISRWCTMHGFAFNVRSNLAGFALMRPCGLEDVEMTDLETELAALRAGAGSQVSIDRVKTILLGHFNSVFNYS